jgi:A/G-specific adenine glycosylase
MLQQTQANTVIPYYRRFVERFPDPFTLAEASEDEVLGFWSGLGYYGRARSLLAAARAVVDRHAGRVPRQPEVLRSLPGVGRYTAGAIASIAFGLEEPVLDGNVRRVLCRLTANPGNDSNHLWRLAGVLVRGNDPGDLNQALMELGATTCTPRKPSCGTCPLRKPCRANGSGRPEKYPHPRRTIQFETVPVAVAVARRGTRVLLERPGTDNPFRGTWDLPALVTPVAAEPRRAIESALRRRHALVVRIGERAARASHAIMQRRLRIEAFECRLLGGRPSERPDLRWIRTDEILTSPVSGATRKILRATVE